MPRVRTAPVTQANWDDFTTLFETKGCPHYCCCTPYRIAGSPDMTKAKRKAAVKDYVDRGTPIGILAYIDDEPVGWCSVAPRETYQKLDDSHTMPRVDDQPTWTILCFFVRRDHRGTGVTKRLIQGAVAEARKNGARVIEGYPFDTAGITSQHRGHSSVFAGAGFKQNGRRWHKGLRPAATRQG